MIYGVRLDYKIIQVAIGSIEMMNCRNVFQSLKDAEDWVQKNGETK